MATAIRLEQVSVAGAWALDNHQIHPGIDGVLRGPQTAPLISAWVTELGRADPIADTFHIYDYSSQGAGERLVLCEMDELYLLRFVIYDLKIVCGENLWLCLTRLLKVSKRRIYKA